jgi:hypothetical protein
LNKEGAFQDFLSSPEPAKTLLINKAGGDTSLLLVSVQHNHTNFTHQSKMGIAPRIPTSWASMRVEKPFSFRGSVLRILLLVLLFGIFAYIIWLPIFCLFQAFLGAFSHQKQPVVLGPGDE